MSNAESGDGRPDVLIIPKDTSKKGAVIEFKTVKSGEEDVLKAKAKEALNQISKMNYTDELKNSGISEALEIAIVFHGKKVYIDYDIKQIT